MEQDNKIIIFQETEIRRVWHNEEWWFDLKFSIAVENHAITNMPQPDIQALGRG